MLLQSAVSLVTLFFSAPLSVVPLLDSSARMDMVDLFEAGQPAQVGNRYGGVSEMTVLTDSLILLRLTDVSTMELRLLPDTTLSVRHTVTTPDSVSHTRNIRYNRSFNPVK